MAVSNTDDHLRNHAFIFTREGWKLSPLFDVNPVPYGDELSLNVSKEDNRIDVELALPVTPYFGISPDAAESSAEAILGVVRNNWRGLAAKEGLSRRQTEDMAPAFSLSES